MQITLLLFASHRELAGTGRMVLDVAPGSTAGDLYDMLQDSHPRLGALRPYTTFAVNREVVEPATRLHPGDEVAFLQPASGGSS